MSEATRSLRPNANSISIIVVFSPSEGASAVGVATAAAKNIG